MGIRDKLERLVARMHDTPQYNSQGAVLFVDLEQRRTLKKYLPLEVLKNFLGGRGANMWLLYNLVEEEREPQRDERRPGVRRLGRVRPAGR